MRIGIDAHIILPKHKRYDPKIARYTEQLIRYLMEADAKKEHTWVLFFDERMPVSETDKLKRDNVEIKRFPFVQYRRYLPVVYSHMLISSFLVAARLDLFHSPEGLIPFLYPGKIITTFHYVPRGKSESNLFVKTFMFGAQAAFSQLCKRAKRIIVDKPSDKKLLSEVHGYDAGRVVVMESEDLERVDWGKYVEQLVALYGEVAHEKEKQAAKKKQEKETRRKAKSKKPQ
jgi:hypothetical protein